MSEEAQASTDGQQIAAALPPAASEAPESQDRSESQEQTETPSHSQPRTNGSYQPPVDLSGLPDDIRTPIEGRFAHLSRLMKKSEIRHSNELNQWRELAAQQSRAIDELQNGVGAVVDHLQDKSLGDAEAQARRELKAAHESGDSEAFITANDRLAEIKARKIALEQQKKTQKPVQTKPNGPAIPSSASQLANDAMADGEIGSEEAQIINAYQTETDDMGNLVRPWAHARTANPQDDPVFVQALINAKAVWSNPRFASPQQKLAELDRIMGTQRRAPSQNVMGGNLTNNRTKAKITLTPNQENIAIKTKFGGPKAKSNADHIEAYRKQIEAVNAKRGVRK